MRRESEREARVGRRRREGRKEGRKKLCESEEMSGHAEVGWRARWCPRGRLNKLIKKNKKRSDVKEVSGRFIE